MTFLFPGLLLLVVPLLFLYFWRGRSAGLAVPRASPRCSRLR